MKYHFDFIGDKLIIGKFCMIASGVTFIMNGANHKMDGVTTYPFYIFGGDWARVTPELSELPYKGDTVIGNDVWIGANAVQTEPMSKFVNMFDFLLAVVH